MRSRVDSQVDKVLERERTLEAKVESLMTALISESQRAEAHSREVEVLRLEVQRKDAKIAEQQPFSLVAQQVEQLQAKFDQRDTDAHVIVHSEMQQMRSQSRQSP